MAIPDNEVEDFSPSATLTFFNPKIPLLRGPIPTGLSDDPSLGPFLLGFKDVRSWKSAFQACKSNIIAQCEGGARIGCSINASSKCKPPWWKIMFGGAAMDISEREKCEEREMSACLAVSKESCLKFAKNKCLAPFSDARISLIDQKEITKIISRASSKLTSVSQSSNHGLTLCDIEVTNYRGSDLLRSENSSDESGSKQTQETDRKQSSDDDEKQELPPASG